MLRNRRRHSNSHSHHQPSSEALNPDKDMEGTQDAVPMLSVFLRDHSPNMVHGSRESSGKVKDRDRRDGLSKGPGASSMT